MKIIPGGTFTEDVGAEFVPCSIRPRNEEKISIGFFGEIHGKPQKTIRCHQTWQAGKATRTTRGFQIWKITELNNQCICQQAMSHYQRVFVVARIYCMERENH